MATPYCDCDLPDRATGAPLRPFAPRAAPLSAMAARVLIPLIAAAGALWSLPWHATGSSGAGPAVLFSLATAARAGARLRTRIAGIMRRRPGVW